MLRAGDLLTDEPLRRVLHVDDADFIAAKRAHRVGFADVQIAKGQRIEGRCAEPAVAPVGLQRAGEPAIVVVLIGARGGELHFQIAKVLVGHLLLADALKELGVENGDTVTVILTEDKSEFGVDVPEELEELFKQDPEGKRRFDLLKPGMQRYILNFVNTVKSPQLRVDKAFMLINNLKNLMQGKETFKEILGK